MPPGEISANKPLSVGRGGKAVVACFIIAAQARIYDSDGLGGLVFVFSAQFTGISCSAQGLERHYLFKMATLILTE